VEPSILILTMGGDVHAVAVEESLRERGVEPVVWYTSDFPRLGTESVRFDDRGRTWALRGPGVDTTMPAFDTVWFRRPLHVTDMRAVHPQDRMFASRQSDTFRRGLYNVLADGAFCVNPYDRGMQAESKLYQQHVAASVGLETPDTLFSNDPSAIRDFVRAQGGRVVYKPLQSHVWQEAGNFTTYTFTVGEDELVADALLQAAPGIYQASVPKAYELRVTVVGRHVLAAKVHSQETETGKLDWRRSYHELQMSGTRLPQAVEERILRLMDRLGLMFGCVDLIVTPDGRHVFLEVNQMGQFLFVEMYTGLPVLDAFCELLVQRRPDFAWDPSRPRLFYSDIDARCVRRSEDETRLHPSISPTASTRGDSGSGREQSEGANAASPEHAGRAEGPALQA
jgi:glutathione synthase/RimK-type ligase-like ATP-grasp enzyme